MISVIEYDDENEGESRQQRQRAFPGRKHGEMWDGRDRGQTSGSVHARRVGGQKHQAIIAKERRQQGCSSCVAVEECRTGGRTVWQA